MADLSTRILGIRGIFDRRVSKAHVRDPKGPDRCKLSYSLAFCCCCRACLSVPISFYGISVLCTCGSGKKVFLCCCYCYYSTTPKCDSEDSVALIGTSENARIDPYDFIEFVFFGFVEQIWGCVGMRFKIFFVCVFFLFFFKITRCQRSTQFR